MILWEKESNFVTSHRNIFKFAMYLNIKRELLLLFGNNLVTTLMNSNYSSIISKRPV